MATELPENPLSLGEIFLQSFRLFKKHFLMVFIFTVLVYLPINFFSLWAEEFFPVGESFFAFYLRLGLYAVFGLLVYMFLALLVESEMKGEPLSGPKIKRQLFVRWLPAIGTNLLTYLILFF